MAITNLTNTTWKFNTTTCEAGLITYYIDYTVRSKPGINFTQLKLGFYYDQGLGTAANSLVGVYGSSNDQYENIVVNDVITFTGGASVTHSDLITWIQANATQYTVDMVVDLTTLGLTAGTTYTIYATAYAEGYVESPASNEVSYTATVSEYDITCTLSHLTADQSSDTTITAGGTATVILNADTGYGVPPTSSGITVTNATISGYIVNNDATPATCTIVLGSATGNVTVTATGLEKLTTPGTDLDGSTLNIYSNDEDTTSYGVYVQGGSYTNPTKVATVQVPSGYEVTVQNLLPRSITFYDGEDNTGTLLGTIMGGFSDTFNVTSGFIYGDGPVGAAFTNSSLNIYLQNPCAVTQDMTLDFSQLGGSND